MSILDALKVQKASQQSVTDLAMLPQNEIIRLAQMGQIPADVVPVVISEKARMAKEMANLRAAQQMEQQGGRMPTVIEQAMQENAQAEAPQMPPGIPGAMPGAQAQAPMQMPPQAQPQAAPQEAGVAGLPTGDMFKGQNFEAGGIVAFSGGGVPHYDGTAGSFVETPGGLNVLREELPKEPGARPSSLADFIREYKDITSGARVESPEEQAYREAVKKGTLSQGDIEQQKYMRLLQAGLGIMGGESPYAFSNIGKGSQEALKGYAEDVASQRAQKMLDLKTAAESAKTRRSEELQDIQGGSKLYESYLDRELREKIAKDSQLGAKYADNYLAMKRTMGDKRPDEVIRDEGYNMFFEKYGFASGRAATQAQIAAGSQAVQGAGITERYANQAQDSVDRTLGKMASPEAREYRKLQKEDPAKAEKYRQDLINQRARELASAGQAVSGGGAAPKPAPAAAPTGSTPPDISKIQGAPSGSKVGAFVQGKGWEIRGKDGTLIGYAKQ